MLYFTSLYFKRSVFTGANKRFDELGRLYVRLLPKQFRIIVCEGEQPDWAPDENCLFVPAYRNQAQRLRAFVALQSLLRRLDPGIVVSDFMPIPFFGLRKHEHYQLIYDLRNFTEFKRGGLSFLTEAFQKRQLTRSTRIITISDFSRNDIVKYCSIAPQKIVVSYCGIDQAHFAAQDQRDRTIDILYVATFEPRKNHAALVRALGLSPSGLRVRFIGRDLGTRDEVMAMANTLVEDKGFEIEFIDSVSEAELIDSYRNAGVYVFPSLLEGFGMPLIEAMATNCRVACSDIEVFREICEDHAMYFDPLDAKSIWSSIDQALNSESASGTSNYATARFSWEKIGRDLLNDLGLQPQV